MLLRAFALAALCAAALPAAGTASFPGANGRLVFTQGLPQVHRFATPSIYLCSADPDGRRQSRLTDGQPLHGAASFRPQGDRIVFVRGITTVHGAVWAAAPDGTDQRRLGDFFGADPAWSADGQSLFVSIDGQIWRVAWPSGQRTQVTTSSQVAVAPAASPDGTRLAYVAGGRLVVRRLADGVETSPAPDQQAENPDWSPDSQSIVFGDRGRIHVLGPRGGFLTEGSSPVFSPDGRTIAFVRGGDIWTVDALGATAPVNLTNSPPAEAQPAWQPLPAPSTPRAEGTQPCAIVGTDGDDVLVGTDGDDVFLDKDGDDEIRGLGGNDVVWGGAGADAIDTGDGADIVKLGPGRKTIRLGDGDDAVELVAGTPPTGPLTVFGGPGADRINGSTAGDRILGEDGDDRISGGRGPDLLFGGPGNDRLQGNRGDDHVDGGLGDDVLFGGPVNGRPSNYDGYDVLLGGPGDDRLAGGWQKDRLFGGPGRDRLSGGLHADLLDGGPHPDILLGDGGDDLLLARDGSRDELWGGAGFDRATADGVDRLRGIERRLR